MNKLFTKIAGSIIGMAMAIGVGVAVGRGEVREAKAAYQVVYTLTPTATGSNSTPHNNYNSAATKTFTNNGISIEWSVTGNSSYDLWRIGGKSLNGVERAIFSNNSISDDISKVEISSGTSTLDSVSLTLSVHNSSSDASTGANPIATLIESTETNFVGKTKTFSKADSTSWAGKYYRIVYTCSTAENSNKFITFEGAVFSKTVADDAPTITLDNTNPEKVLRGGSTSISATVAHYEGSVSWSASPSEGVSFNSNTSETTVTIGNSVPLGTDIEISATISSGTVSTPVAKHLVVYSNSGTSANNAFEADEAVGLIKRGLFEADVDYWAKGFVKTTSGASYYNTYITTGSDNSSTLNQDCLYVYGPSAGDGVSLSNLATGKFITAKGKLTYYSNNQPEMTSATITDITTIAHNISITVSNGTSNAPETIEEGNSVDITITPNSGYKVPTSVSVSGATYTYEAGVIHLSNPTGDVTITASCLEATSYTITVTESHCSHTGATSIYESGTATLTFTADTGYLLPESLTPTGASVKTWIPSTGVLVLENPTANVTLSVTAIEGSYTNTSELDPGTYYIKYSTHYFTGTISSGKGTSDTDKPNSNGQFTFTLAGNDVWTVVNGAGKYLTIGDGSTTLGLSDDFSTLIVEKGSTTGTYKIKGSSGRYIAWYSSGSDFRTYTSGTLDLTLEDINAVTKYTVTYDANGGTGTMTDSNSPYNSGAIVTTMTNTFTREGYTFAHWSTATDGTGTDYEEGATFTISENVTLYAIWDQNGSGSVTAARCYHHVTDASDLVAGAKYIITNATDHANGFYAMSTNQKASNRGATSISVTGSVAAVSVDDAQIITLGGSTGAWTLSVGEGYLYASSSSGNQLKTQAENDENGQWAITFTDGAASIVAQGGNTRNIMRYNYNNGSPLFACYNSASQSEVHLYRLDFGETLLHNITCDGEGSYTIASGYSWNDLKGVYQDLPLSEQNSLKTASNNGLARYDYLIAKYGTGTFENFIGRTITPLSGDKLPLSSLVSESSSVITIITVISVLSLIALGGFFFIKKRKEQ